jgi:acetolactate synthase I/III small subunit
MDASTLPTPPSAADDAVREAVLTVIVDNEPGILARVVGLVSARGYNIESLSVAETDVERHTSRITLVTSGTRRKIEQIKAQLGRLVPVRQVIEITDAPHAIERELALVKLVSDGARRTAAAQVAERYNARALDLADASAVYELTDTRDRINDFIALMKPLGLTEVSRTGVVSIRRGANSD